MNAVFAGLAFLIPALLDVTIGNIQGGVIDWLVFGVFQGMDTGWWTYLITGPIFFALYYFSYRFVITKFNVASLGRSESDFEDFDSSLELTQDDMEVENKILAEYIIEGLGGLKNITDIDNCISRLRVEILDENLINEELLKKTNPAEIIRPDTNTIHVVYGGRVTKMRNVVDDYIDAQK